MTRASSVVAACLALLALAPSCADESIVLATVASNDSGAPAAPAPIHCVSSCPAGTYCAKTSCASDATGTCQLFPVCDGTESPVCGCDQITYFNDCLRQAAGIAASTPGECPFDNALPCGVPQAPSCPDPTQSCARLNGPHGPCDQNFPGTCWVLPATCPPAMPGADRWNSCEGPGMCLSTCAAIQTNQPYRRSFQCAP